MSNNTDMSGNIEIEEQSQFTQYTVDNMADFAYWITPDGRFVYVNKAATEHLGYSVDELLGMKVSDVNPEHPPKTWKSHWRELREKKKLTFEAGLRAKDGHMLPVEITANYVQFGGKEYDCAIARDITERKRVEETLKAGEERFRTIFDSVNDAISIHDAQTLRIVEVNQRMCEMFGITREEFPSMMADDLAAGEPPYTGEAGRELMRKTAEEGPQLFEFLAKNRAGERFWVEGSARKATIKGIDRMIVIYRNITERKQVEKELEQERRLTEAVFNSVPGFLFVLNEQGYFVRWNKRLEEASLVPIEKIPEFQVFRDSPWTRGSRERALAAFNKALAEGHAEFEGSYLDMRGEEVMLFLTAERFILDDKPYVTGIAVDITDRIRAEDTLRASEERFRTIFDSVNDAIFIHDAQTLRVVDVNQRVAEMFGYASREEALHITGHDIVSGEPPYTYDSGLAIMRKALTEGPQLSEFRVKKKTGERFWIEGSARKATILDADRLIVIYRDITERKKVEETLRASEERFRTIFDSVNDSIFLHDAETLNIIEVNERASEMFGFPREEAPNISGRDIVSGEPPYTYEAGTDVLRKAVTEGPQVLEFHVKNMAGERFWVEGSARKATILGADRLIVIYRDITERKKADETLRASEERFRTIFDSVNDAIFLQDAETFKIVEVNERVADMFGYTREEALNIRGVDIVSGEPPYTYEAGTTILRKAVTEGPQLSEFRVKKKTGERFWIEGSARKATILGADRLIVIYRDITERKKVEETLKASEERFRTIFDSINDAIFIQDVDTFAAVDINMRATEMFGFTREEAPYIKGKDIVSGEPPYTVENALAIMRKAMVEGPQINEFHVKNKAGERFWVEGSARKAPIQGVDRLVIVYRDITERKEVEKELEQERLFTDATFDSVPGSIYLLDEQGHFVRWNRRFEEEWYLPLEDIPRVTIQNLPWTADSGMKVKAAIERIFAEEYAEVEASMLTKEGVEKTFLFTGERLAMDGRPYIVGVAIDITERERAEVDLALTNKELLIINSLISATAGAADPQSIVDMAADAAVQISGLEGSTVCLIKPDGVFQLAAQRATSAETIAELESGVIKIGECLCGKCAETGEPLILSTKEEVLEYATREALRKEDIRFHAAFPLMVESMCIGVLCVFTRTDKKPSERNLKLLETASKQIAIAIERAKLFEEVKRNARELEQRVSERTIQLENANKEMEAFSFSVSHDLRAPLRAIDGFSLVMLEDYSDELDEEGKGFLNRIRAAAVRMGVLIDDILRLSRVNRAEMVRTRVNLSEIANSIASDLKESQPERKVEFIIEPDLIANADPNLIKVALENLVGNAWKFTGKRDAARIEFGTIKEKGKIVYYIRDNGVGFDQTYVDKLFIAFQRLHSDAEFPGTGIGLATVKRIIRRHGGETWAEGEVDKGATFYFTLEGGR